MLKGGAIWHQIFLSSIFSAPAASLISLEQQTAHRKTTCDIPERDVLWANVNSPHPVFLHFSGSHDLSYKIKANKTQ